MALRHHAFRLRPPGDAVQATRHADAQPGVRRRGARSVSERHHRRECGDGREDAPPGEDAQPRRLRSRPAAGCRRQARDEVADRSSKMITMLRFVPYVAVVCGLSLWAQTPPIHVTLLGTSGPSVTRSVAEAGLLVEAGGETLLFDCGRGVPERIMQLGPSKSGPRLAVNKVFLSHLHSDHTEGLPILWMTGWTARGNNPLNVWGPGPDVDQPTGSGDMLAQLQTAFATNTHIRRDLVESNPEGGIMIHATEVSEGVVYQNNGVTVTAFLVDHHPVKPAFGYRVDYAGRSVVFSGDTTHSDNLINFAKGADLIIHEVLIPAAGADLSVPNAIRDYHTTPEQAADVFKQTAPRMAV